MTRQTFNYNTKLISLFYKPNTFIDYFVFAGIFPILYN